MSKADKTNITNSRPVRTALYLSITAESHAELCDKIETLHAGFCVPAPAVTTRENVRDALNGYVDRHGMPQGRALIQQVCGEGVLSLSQIPEDKYVTLVAVCNAGAARH